MLIGIRHAAARLDGRAIDDIVDAGIGDATERWRKRPQNARPACATLCERCGQRGAVDVQRQNAGDGQRSGELARGRAQRFVCGHGDDARVGFRHACRRIFRMTANPSTRGSDRSTNDEGRRAAAGDLLQAPRRRRGPRPSRAAAFRRRSAETMPPDSGWGSRSERRGRRRSSCRCVVVLFWALRNSTVEQAEGQLEHSG